MGQPPRAGQPASWPQLPPPPCSATLPPVRLHPKLCPQLNALSAHALSSPCQVLYGVNQRLRVEDVDSPLVAQRPVKSVALVIVTGDRGLCGGYNK